MKKTISKKISWSMGHRIPHHELDQNLHGHRFELEVTISRLDESHISQVEEADMVIDIIQLKKILETKITKPLDHAFIFWEQDKLMADFFQKNSTLKHLCLSKTPSMENILIWINNQLIDDLKKHQTQLEKIQLWESATSSATLDCNQKTPHRETLIIE